MSKIEKRIWIQVPLKKVFAFTDDGRNTATYYDSVYDWKPVGKKYKGTGVRFSYKRRDLGIEYNIETEITNVVVNKSRTFETVGSPKVTARWFFESVDDGTIVAYVLEYELPIPVIGKLIDILYLKKKREADTERMLQNLKKLLENSQDG